MENGAISWYPYSPKKTGRSKPFPKGKIMPSKFSTNLSPEVDSWLKTGTNYPHLWQNIFGITAYINAISTTSIHLVSRHILKWDTTVGRSPLRDPSPECVERLYSALKKCHRVVISVTRVRISGDFRVKMQYFSSGENPKLILEVIGTIDASCGVKDLYIS